MHPIKLLNKSNIIFLVFFFVCLTLQSQTALFQWGSRMVCGGIDQVNSMVIDSAGNVYTIGQFPATSDFNPGPDSFNLISNGGIDIFISKIDANGNFVWAKQIGGIYDDMAYSLTIDYYANLYFTGTYRGNVDFNPGPITNFLSSTNNSVNMFFCKLDSAGNYKFAWSLGTNASYPTPTVVKSDSLGNIFIGGSFYGTVDFDPSGLTTNLVSAGSADIFISKFSSLGNHIWTKRMGGTAGDLLRNLTIDGWGNIYSTGLFTGTVDFDPGTGTSNLTGNNSDIFISKLDSGGNYVWAKRIAGSTTQNRTYGIEIDPEGRVIIAGTFVTNTDFDPGTGTFNMFATTQDVFVLKLTATGNFLWAKKFTGNSTSSCGSLSIDYAGNIYTTGSFKYNFDFNPGIDSFYLYANADNVFISKLSSAGNFVWALHLSDNFPAIGLAISVEKSGKYIYTSGYYRDTIDLDPGPGTYRVGVPPLNNWDIFFQKMKTCEATTHNLMITACDSFVYNNITYKTSGQFTHKYPNAAGCDSIVKLILSIWRSSSSYKSDTACTIFSYNGITYTTSGTYTQVLTNKVGCDSTITLKLIINSNIIHTISASACNSYSLNGITYVNSGSYVQHFQSVTNCDSDLILNLTIKKSSSNIINASSCLSYKLNSITYTLSGTYTQTLMNAVGCDSFIILNLTIKNNSGSFISATACKSYSINNQTYTLSGQYTQTISNVAGCDSTITINLIIYGGNSSIVGRTSCKSYQSPSGKYTWFTSGTYNDTLSNKLGCDSVITIVLTVNNPNITVTKTMATLKADASSAQYQWLDCNNNKAPISGKTSQVFIPSINGNYAVIVTQNSCIDTSICYNVSNVGITKLNESGKIIVFPNPANNVITISGYSSKTTSFYTIKNTLGQTILKGELKYQETEIDISMLAKGNYIIEIYDQDIIRRIKIMKD